MNSKLLPRNIYQNYIKNNISRAEVITLLGSYIENSHNLDLRLESLNFLNKLEEKTKSIFKILETCLISDENEELRVIAMEALFRNYQNESFESLKWTILNDKSSLVLQAIKNIIEKGEIKHSEDFKKIFNERFQKIAKNYNITIQEVPVLIDLRFNLVKSIYSDFIYDNYSICVIRNNYIRELSLSFKSSLPESIGSLKKLETLDLRCNNLSSLPESLSHLKKLRYLNLSWNNFTHIPKFLTKMDSLEFLDLSNNNIKNIPESIKKLKRLKTLFY
ncbi:MAG: leucine-rich repeat domain-containing protein [Candidatus Hodarchaeota archaeon]